MDYASIGSKMSKQVSHVYHLEWLGIRSAVQSLDGFLVPISYREGISDTQMVDVLAELEKTKTSRVVFHGFSRVANQLLQAISRMGLECYLVWHGNFAQLAWEPENKYFTLALEAARKGYFKRCHVMKASQSEIFPKGFFPMLPNVIPANQYGRVTLPFEGKTTTAFVAATNDIRKNPYVNLYAATTSREVDTVLHYMKITTPISDRKKLKWIKYEGLDKHLAIQCEVDICINVTIIDCLPMVDLEALSAGTPSISGPLFRDFLTDHPYVGLSEVSNPFDVSAIRERITYISQIPAPELAEIITDFAKKLDDVSRERYEDFLNL